MIKLTDILNEIKINQPGKIENDKDLFNFLKGNIRKFAEHELTSRDDVYSIVINEFIESPPNIFTDDELNEIEDNTWEELDNTLKTKLKPYLIDILVNIGLTFFQYDDNTNKITSAVSWDTEIGLIYSYSDEADPGSYTWDEDEFLGKKFYSLSFDI
jgi:hypothetical protein